VGVVVFISIAFYGAGTTARSRWRGSHGASPMCKRRAFYRDTCTRGRVGAIIAAAGAPRHLAAAAFSPPFDLRKFVMPTSPIRSTCRRTASALVAATLVALAVSADAATLRWAGRGDMQTTDPHSQNENLTNNINILVYETLVARDKKLGLAPSLAESWTQVNPTTWRFKLRAGVKFHDGTPFTADDVVFSFERARSDTSQLRAYANAAGIAKAIDPLTVEFTTTGPNPIEVEHVALINIMSRAWCEKNRATKPQNYTQKEDMVTAREANGTGPYVLKSRQPDVRTVLAKNPAWWGLKLGLYEGNADEVIYLPIGSDATRIAALISGEVDLVNDPPPQDVPRLKQTQNIKVLEGFENRIVFIGMDQQRDELVYSNVKGKNPFKDKRVRQALYQAIDIEAIKTATMRGLAQPSGAMLSSPIQSTPELEKRLPFDRAKAKELLTAAGYPNGFEVTLDCPNNRYINDEKICQALAAMWAQIGVKIAVNAMPRATYFPKLEKLDTSLYMLGWGGGTTDAIFILQPVLATYSGKGDGDYNYGRYTNAAQDALIAKIKVEMNPDARLKEIREALALQAAEINHLPLHRQVIPWAARSNVSAVHRADNQVIPLWVTVK
jgi:peptide/nickel transport system substrate-binding protein